MDRVEKTWPEEDMTELEAYAREIGSGRTGLCDMSDEEEAAVLEGLAEAERGEFVSDEDRAAALKRYGL
jgi:hypothetical protein